MKQYRIAIKQINIAVVNANNEEEALKAVRDNVMKSDVLPYELEIVDEEDVN